MGLDKLLYLQGVGSEYIDYFGQLIQIPESDRLGILRTMLNDDERLQELTDSAVAERIEQLDAQQWTIPLPAFQWSWHDECAVHFYLPVEGQPVLELTIHTGTPIHVTVPAEQLHQIGDYCHENTWYRHVRVYLKDILNREQIDQLSPGYYDLTLNINPQTALVGQWMLAPRQAFGLDARNQSLMTQRYWGVNIQLYSLKSRSPWCIGDFAALDELIPIVAEQGADFILLNPLHMLDFTAPDDASPYSPSDRRRLNPLYIDIQGVAEYPQVQNAIKVSKALASGKDKDWLDYELISRQKYQAMAVLYQQFSLQHKKANTARGQAFQQFIQQQGDSLQLFAQHEAQKASRNMPKDPLFYCYLQFVAEQQLADCQQRALAVGMTIGLIRDLAVGAVPQGEEVQRNADQFCLAASIGAPPDPFAPQGQNWQLTPLDPVKLRQHQYQHFIQLIRANMQHCGALRIDHIMSIMRLWWWPRDPANGQGAYVYFDVDTMLAILCLESHLAECAVIGEDLGVVPPEIVAKLLQAGIVSNELFFFCKQGEQFKSPDEYKAQSMMMLTNHDVPTFAAWWQGQDLLLRRKLQLIVSDDELHQCQQQREQERHQVLLLLQQHGAVDSNMVLSDLTFELVLPALAGLVASGQSVMFSIPLSDLMGDSDPVNIPGTWKEYPNWRHRHHHHLTYLKQHDVASQTMEKIASARQQNNSRT